MVTIGVLRRPLFTSQLYLGLRAYHDESFGFRKAREFELPDCEQHSLECYSH
jgi:hypothetical protein